MIPTKAVAVAVATTMTALALHAAGGADKRVITTNVEHKNASILLFSVGNVILSARRCGRRSTI